MKIKLYCKDQTVKITEALEERYPDKVVYTMSKECWEQAEQIDFLYDLFAAGEGDEGYYIIPQQMQNEQSVLTYFHGHEGQEYVGKRTMLPFYGARIKGQSYLAVITGMTYEYELIGNCVDGRYALFPRFYTDRCSLYESVQVVVYEVTGDHYCDIPIKYRELLLESGRCQAIKDRENENLKYARESLYVRIRQAWKPVPTPVLEQTLENEPKLRVACTFAQVENLMRKCHEKGVEKAEFCLVGWNIKGHDGRWPQIFPVEPELGGEEGLASLLKTAKELGYQVSCHTNSTDAYQIADCWDEDLLRKDIHGNIVKDGTWSGGQMYQLCPKKALEIAQKELPKVAELGFGGLHYIDVIDIVAPRDCYDPKHPLTKREAVAYNIEIAKLAKDLFGGFSSEGSYDHMAEIIDFGLYTYFCDFRNDTHAFSDEVIPVWELVYHGIILANPYTVTVNALPENGDVFLKVVECCGRPSAYFYSKFVDEDGKRKNWMGKFDFTCATEEEAEHSAKLLKKIYDEYQTYAYLQTEFITKYEKLGNGVCEVTYEDGSVVTIDYNKKVYKIKKG